MVKTENRITFREMVNEAAHIAGITQTDALNVIYAFVNVIKQHLFRKKIVSIPHFGTFSLTWRKGRIYNNPYVDVHNAWVPPHYEPHLRFARSYKLQVRKVPYEDE